AIIVLAVEDGPATRVMLYFGTGREHQQTSNSGKKYAKGTQTFYGIWDWDMDDWNAKSQTHYASLNGFHTIERNKLLEQKVQEEGTDITGSIIKGHRTLSTDKTVCWKGDASVDACELSNQYGWRFDLPGKGPESGPNKGAHEQIIYDPKFAGGAVVVNTAIPPFYSADQCKPGLQSGWTMAFNPRTGGGFKLGFVPGPG